MGYVGAWSNEQRARGQGGMPLRRTGGTTGGRSCIVHLCCVPPTSADVHQCHEGTLVRPEQRASGLLTSPSQSQSIDYNLRLKIRILQTTERRKIAVGIIAGLCSQTTFGPGTVCSIDS